MDTINAPIEFLQTIARMGWQARNAALTIAPLLIIIVATFGVVRFYFGQESNNKINLNKYLFYNIFMLVILMNYHYVIDTTGSFTRILTDVFPRVEGKEMFKRISDAKIGMYDYTKQGKQLDAQKKYDAIIDAPKISWFEKMYFKALQRRDAAEAVYDSNPMGSTLDWLISLMEVSFIRLVRTILEISRSLMLGFLIVVGPFALMFELLPLMRGIASHWFKLFIAVSLWLLTLNVLDYIYIGFAEAQEISVANALDNSMMSTYRDTGYENFTGQMTEGGHTGILNLAMAIMYMFVPFLTTVYAGGQVAQQLFGAMMSMAQMATVGAMGLGVGKGAGAKPSTPPKVIGKTTDNT